MDLAHRPVELAVALARAGAEVVVVGGTARHLRGAARAPRDLDLAVSPPAVNSLVVALESLGARTTPARLLRCRCSAVATTYGPLDVFVGPLPASVPLEVAGVALQVAT